MADRVYPSSKPTSNPQTLNPTAPANQQRFPAVKSQPYGTNRPIYRPQPRRHHRSRRTCCCLCCIWSTIFLLALILLLAIAAGALYLLYHPHRPNFSLSTLKLSQLNLTTAADSTSHLTSQLNLTISAQNPNKKLTFFYKPITVIVESNGVQISNGSFPSFAHLPQNTTLIRISASGSRDLDTEGVSSLRSELKKRNGLPVKVVLETKVKAKLGGLKSNSVGIRVTCEGASVVAPKGKSTSVASIDGAECKVDLRIKIWKFTL